MKKIKRTILTLQSSYGLVHLYLLGLAQYIVNTACRLLELLLFFYKND